MKEKKMDNLTTQKNISHFWCTYIFFVQYKIHPLTILRGMDKKRYKNQFGISSPNF